MKGRQLWLRHKNTVFAVVFAVALWVVLDRNIRETVGGVAVDATRVPERNVGLKAH